MDAREKLRIEFRDDMGQNSNRPQQQSNESVTSQTTEGTSEGLVVQSGVRELVEFAKTCSNQTLGDLQLSRMNSAANQEHDFKEAVQKLLQHVLKIVDMADSWAQKEAESRYVSFLRQHELLRREEQVVEAKKVVRKRTKLLTE